MTTAILGFLATILPIVLSILDKRMSKPLPKPKPINYVKNLQETDNEEEIEIVWAEHDDDLERLL